ncbi:MAG: hypothetical protein J5908_08260 [Selenomonas sp.]|nr:hypothetical protein [Selenomonas sp.]
MIEGPCCNARKMAERIDRINEQYGGEVLGFCFDTGHANLVGLDMEDFVTVLGPRLLAGIYPWLAEHSLSGSAEF